MRNMYLMREYTTHDEAVAAAIAVQPLGPGLSAEAVEGCDRLEVWGTRADAPGPEYCEFRVFRGDVLLARGRIDGY